MGKKLLVIISIIIVVICSYYFISKATNKANDKGDYQVTDINIYKGTPAWELALAVRDQKTTTIEKIAKENPSVLNYQDPKYGATLLLWAVGTEKYNSAEELLKCGANPNIEAQGLNGETPLFTAAGYSWIDNDAKKDPKYVNLLLQYGADPNKNYTGSDTDVIEPGTSPLMNSMPCGIEKTKALVEAGADINYKTKTGNTAAITALLNQEVPEYAYYLIVEKKAKVSDPYYRGTRYGSGDPNEKFSPVTLLRNWVFKLDSPEYQMKMEIVNEFARQGVNYWDTPISTDRLAQIHKLYPDTWEDYIKKY